MGTDDSNKMACLVWLVFLVTAGKVFCDSAVSQPTKLLLLPRGLEVLENFLVNILK